MTTMEEFDLEDALREKNPIEKRRTYEFNALKRLSHIAFSQYRNIKSIR